MEDKEIKQDIKSKYISILMKINHKPLIMTSIYSFVQNRPYILLHLISTNTLLKSSLINTFNNSRKNNTLSVELNKNINKYIFYRKLKENLDIKLQEIKSKIFKYNEKLNLLIHKPNPDIKNNNELIINFIKETLDFSDAQNIILNYVDKNYNRAAKKLLEMYYSNYLETCQNQGKYYYYYSIMSKFFNTDEFRVEEEYFYDNYYQCLKNRKAYFNDIIMKELNKRKNVIFNEITKVLIEHLTYYDYVMEENEVLISYFTKCVNPNNKALLLEIIFFNYYNKSNFDEIYRNLKDILLSEYDKLPYSTKKYRNICQKKLNHEIKNNGYNLYIKNIKQSVILELVEKYIKNKYDKDLVLNLCFDFLTTLDSLYLYNLPNEIKENDYIKDNTDELNDSFLDAKYLRYIEDKNMKQKISLICIIDRYNFSEYINNIIYPHIYELHFTLFTNSSFDEFFMFNNIPIKNIYNIFMTYFLSIKYYENIEVISFGDEFFMNKNQFLNYNDEYYQSIISYLIDQYLFNYNNNGSNILEKTKLKKIELKEDKLNNIYEQFKIIYGFNKLFPNLENKKLLELSYNNDIKNNNILDNNINSIKNKYKIIIINFDNIPIKEDINTIFDNIRIFISKSMYNQITNIEIISFINFIFIANDKDKIINLNNNLDILPNLKEFFINNNTNNNNISNDFSELKLFKKFEYVYLGYDSKDNLIYYRNGKNKIESNDILDLFNIINNKINKLNLKYENIDLILNTDKSILKIINLNNNEDIDIKYNYPLSNLSDFIFNQNTIKELIIEGFDFNFEIIQNKNIKKLKINFNDNNKLNNYIIKTFNNNNFMFERDINLKNKFPLLEEINIGNILNENILFNQLFKMDNFNNNLKCINIITYKNCKLVNINKQKIKTKIINKSNIKLNIEEDNEEEEISNEESDNIDDENEDELFIDNYKDLLEDADPVIINDVPNKKRKIKDNNQKENEYKIILIKEKLNKYKKIEDNLFKKDIKSYLEKEKILYFDSNIINTVNNYYLIHQSLLLINNNIDINKIKFNKLSKLISADNKDKLNIYKSTKNLFIIFITENSKIFCIYLKNDNPKEKGNDFCLDLNDNEIYYHIKKDSKKNKNKNEIKRKEVGIVKKSKKIDNLIDYFFDYDIYNYTNAEFIEIYQIIYNFSQNILKIKNN